MRLTPGDLCWRRLRLASVIGGVLISLALAAPAHAERAWLAPEPLPAAARDVGFGAGTRGEALLTWSEAAAEGRTRLLASFRPPASPWGTPQVIEEIPRGAAPGMLHVAFDAEGDATIAYLTQNSSIRAIDRSHLGGYGKPAVVTDNGSDMRFATNRRGDAIMLWTRGAPTETTTWVSVRRAGAEWSRERQVPTVQRFSRPLVDLDEAGAATIAWTESDEPPEPCSPGPGYCPDDERVRTVTLSPQGDWSSVKTLSGTDATQLRLSVAPDGGAVLTWARPPETAEGAVRSPDGTWSGAEKLVPGVWPVAEALSGGRVFFAWRAAYERRDAQVAVREADGRLGPAHTVAPAGSQASGPRLAAGPDGLLALSWSSSKNGTSPMDSWGPSNPPPDTPASAEVALGTPGAPFDGPAVLNPGETLGPAGGAMVYVRTALGPAGFALALLTRYDGDIDYRVVVRDVPLPPGSPTLVPAPPPAPTPATTATPTPTPAAASAAGGDSRPPALSFRATPRLRVAGRTLRIAARCDERCVLSASGRIAARRRSFAVRAPATTSLAGQRTELRLRVPRSAARARGRLSLRLQATDRAGNRTQRRIRAWVVPAR